MSEEKMSLDDWENKILYKHFREHNPSVLISEIAEDYLTEEEMELYQKELDEE